MWWDSPESRDRRPSCRPVIDTDLEGHFFSERNISGCVYAVCQLSKIYVMKNRMGDIQLSGFLNVGKAKEKRVSILGYGIPLPKITCPKMIASPCL